MAWTNPQKSRAAQAAKVAGFSDEHRQLILRQFGARAVHDGRVTSTSPRLTNQDFEDFMAICERANGGQAPGFSPGRFADASANLRRQLAWKAQRIANTLILHNKADGTPILEPEGGLEGWIEKRVTNGRTRDIEQLNAHELQALMSGLLSWGRQHGVDLRRRVFQEA